MVEYADYAYLTNEIPEPEPVPTVGIPANFGYGIPACSQAYLPDPAFGDVNFNVPSTCISGIAALNLPPIIYTGAIALRIQKTACYEFGFTIRGRNAAQPPNDLNALVFELRVNGCPASSGSRFRSEKPGVALEQVIVEGNGIIRLQANDIVTLRNISGVVGNNNPAAFGYPVSLGIGDNDATVNASLYLIMIPPSVPMP